MPTIGEGRERLELSIPQGYKEKIDHLLEEGRSRFPNRKRTFQDRGTFLAWLIDNAWTILEVYEEQVADLEQRKKELIEQEEILKKSVEEQLRELDKQKKELDEYKQEITRKAAQLVEMENKISQELGMVPYAKQLWMDLVQSNIVSKDEILSTLRTLKEVGINFTEVARAIKEENLQGFIGWAREVKEACIRASDELARLKEEISAHKLAISKLQRAEKEFIDKINAEIDKYDKAVLEAERVCAAARDLGLYLDYIRQSLKANGAEKIQDLLPEPALVIAGTILEAVAAAYGDREVTIPPGPKHLFPVQVTLREIARSLAPVEAYREQQKAQMKMEVMAEGIAANA